MSSWILLYESADHAARSLLKRGSSVPLTHWKALIKWKIVLVLDFTRMKVFNKYHSDLFSHSMEAFHRWAGATPLVGQQPRLLSVSVCAPLLTR